MAQLRVGAERAKEGLLESVVGAIPAEPADEERVDLVTVLGVEALEGRQRHVDIL